jgi:transcriptional regulator with XRE-family HTH domain
VSKVNVVFGKTIAGLRQSAGFSQEELADRAGIHRTYVSQIERGLKSPTIVMLTKLATALNVAPSAVMRLVENELAR